ncbi:MAG: DNA mismatch repair endonuclease MutL [Spirochaetales bacterium]|nr:DNA mismatch repair endonuclease MutL [Spirochaetales bacterium]
MNITATHFSHIAPLPDLLVDKIAAGEVIEGPASIVKECLENSVDAGATSIVIRTSAAGMDSLEITDNGSGIFFADLPLSVQRHATSKIRNLSDLEEIRSMGFRGEALAAIAAVSELTIRSRQALENQGGLLLVRGGELLQHEAVAYPEGTQIIIKDLFYSVPARRKFQKSEKSIHLQIYQEIIKIAIAHPELRLEYIRDGREYLFLAEHKSQEERLAAIFGSTVKDHLLSVEAIRSEFIIHGFLCSGDYFRPRSDRQYIFINNRAVDLKNAGFLIKKAYGELLPPGAYPCFFLFLELDPATVDVNVHPAKKEVRLKDQSQLMGTLINMTYGALHKESPVRLEHKAHHIKPLSPYSLPLQTELVASEVFAVSANKKSGSGSIVTATEEKAAYPEGVHRVQFIKHSGRIFGTYILAEAEDGFYIVDQHTAHERINYEKMRRRFAEQRKEKQILLEPVVIECTAADLEQIEHERERLAENGFTVEVFGRDKVIVREVPVYLEVGTEEDTLWHLIGRILQGETGFALYDELAAMKACKASIKKNDSISGPVISGILEELSECAEPLRCPHGRPTMIRITQEELDRMFMRS